MLLAVEHQQINKTNAGNNSAKVRLFAQHHRYWSRLSHAYVAKLEKRD